ncbi:sulfurtransferase TusA family protein [Halarsenatibacter silvermanii]|uniref:TusA-related sulfurtransferase n=1 Tax=Halarsenatibacter silvermanii TaxID=321763 RepID=A0A1G9QME4_9FIRM|nr:sulfurtransferase TusA family protein [Halarsenatibacter silvermanii]SDM12163.1 TusA-related sulfurtransferase [Halarsenatibacter silvermanii]
MSKKRLDCRGMDCPQPVVETKQALEECSSLDVVLDNETAARNVSRIAENSNFEVKKEFKEEEIILHISESDVEAKKEEKKTKTAQTASRFEGEVRPAANYFITTSRLGEGPEELGEKLA